MLEFWAPALGLIVATGAVLLAALRRADPLAPTSEAADIRVYRDQLSEVARDLARGTIDAEEGARLRAEVARRLLEASRASATPAPLKTGGHLVPGGLVPAILAAAVGGYFWLGAPGYPDLPISARLERAATFYHNRPDQVAAEAAAQAASQAAAGIKGTAPQSDEERTLLEQLRAAVAARPDDLRGHQLLAKSEIAVGNLAAARAAYQRVLELKGAQASPQEHAELAEVMILAAGGVVTPQAEAELVACLRLDPTNPIARFYSGVMLAQVGRPDQAFALWRPLFEESSAQDPWYDPIRSGIEDMAQAAGIDYVLPEDKGPDAAAVAAAEAMPPEERQEMIKGMVGGLEARLLAQGGSAQDWARLVNALGVLGETDRARTAFQAGQTALAGDDAGLASLLQAANSAGVAP